MTDPTERQYRINDMLSALASEFGVPLDDDTLNELTHCVADVFEGGEVTALADDSDGDLDDEGPDFLNDFPRRVTHHHDGHGLAESIIVRADARGVGNASHQYVVAAEDGTVVGNLRYQQGARNAPGSTAGVLDSVLLGIVADRMDGFQSGPFACPENAKVLGHVIGALGTLKKRADERAARGILGQLKA